jgi:AraC family transcriptional regulator
VRRKRVQLAVDRLRGSDCGLAEIAATAGFCDQSHMNRGFQAVLGRTPMQVRAERKLLSRFVAAA